LKNDPVAHDTIRIFDVIGTAACHCQNAPAQNASHRKQTNRQNNLIKAHLSNILVIWLAEYGKVPFLSSFVADCSASFCRHPDYLAESSGRIILPGNLT
jgi:hypothetical protein